MNHSKGKRNSEIAVVAVLSVLVGALLVVQIENMNGRSPYVSASTIQDYEVTIAGEQKEIDNLKLLVSETEAKLQEYESLYHSEEDITQPIKAQLHEDTELYAMASSLRKVTGDGIEVYIDDESRELEWDEDPNDVLVHDSDILIIINALKSAGAEAISVNGERIGLMTAISCSGHTVRINGRTYARPFIIRAIGDGGRLSAALIGPGCPGTILSEYVVFRVSLEDGMEMPAYTGEKEYRYASVVKADSDTKEGETN